KHCLEARKTRIRVGSDSVSLFSITLTHFSLCVVAVYPGALQAPTLHPIFFDPHDIPPAPSPSLPV
ncbi:hypothetical protein, partial [Salmonella enterica]|uniref:hypothetical protein n=1 Tax=Salmonella enterica TaxID=28901 RepID=UPI001C7D840C